MKIGFIGAGQMAQAIISGLNKKKLTIGISGRLPEKTQKTGERLGVQVYASNLELTKDCDIVVLSVKPNIAPKVLSEISPELTEKTILVSICSGLTLSDLAALTSDKLSIIRVMPNVNAVVHRSSSAIVKNKKTSVEAFEQVKEIFEQVGSTHEIKEEDFPSFAALAGSSPAFIYEFIDAMAMAGVKYGLSKSESLAIVAETVRGSAEMLIQSDKHPRALADSVASPAGTTIEGLIALENHAFTAGVIAAITATIEKEKSAL